MIIYLQFGIKLDSNQDAPGLCEWIEMLRIFKNKMLSLR